MNVFKKWLSALFPFLKKKEVPLKEPVAVPEPGPALSTEHTTREPEPVPTVEELPEEQPEGGEELRDVLWNRTLIALPLSGVPQAQPEPVRELECIEDVFAHYRPHVGIALQQDGQTTDEQFSFNSLDDFLPGRIIARSKLLREQQEETVNYRHMQQQLVANKVLRQVLEQPESKRAFLDVLESLVAELDQAG